MAGPILAIVTPDNIPGGSILTFAFPMALFIVAAVVLYLLFTRPHQVPGHKKLASARASTGAPGTARPASPGGAATTAAAAGAPGGTGASTGSSLGTGGSAGGGSAAPAEGTKAED